MIIANKYEFPDSCPVMCPGHSTPVMQGGVCHRCPVFNCRSVGLDEEGNDMGPMLAPEDYREDWAEEYLKYINTGEYPCLPLVRAKKDENIL